MNANIHGLEMAYYAAFDTAASVDENLIIKSPVD